MMPICIDKQYKYTLLKVSSKIKLIAMHKTSAGEKRKALRPKPRPWNWPGISV
jgi:hypothetical protein